MMMMKENGVHQQQPPTPTQRPSTPHFSSGPCAKRPGWSVDVLKAAALGRSHRSALGKKKLSEVIQRTRRLLGLPDSFGLAIVPASDTGAVEMAMWSLLGPRGVDVFAWESFGLEWVTDAVEQLRLPDLRVFAADYGALPDLTQADFSRDIIFTWNGTTSGVRVPDGEWIAADRSGLTICDATSAVFAVELPWDKLDVTTFSWQKMLGGEAQHGMIVLSPRAIERLETHVPTWPIPKILRLTANGKVDRELFDGSTINTPSMLAVEDMLDALVWAESIGGKDALIARTNANFAAVAEWVGGRTAWVDFLADPPAVRSTTSICLQIVDPGFVARPPAEQAAFVKAMTGKLEKEGVAFDIAGYRKAPPGLRIWGGATVERADIEALLPWLDWAFAVTNAEMT